MSLRSSSIFVRFLLLSSLAAAFFGCATAKKPLTGLVPGRELATVQSAVSLSAVSGEHSTAGRGYLLFKAPFRFHLALVSPFGQTVLEAYGDRDLFTCVIPSRQIAYSGELSELPESSVLKSMALLRWVMAPAPFPIPAPAPGQTVVVSGVSYHIDQVGMVERKVSQEGDEVSYERYRSIEGVPFPEEIAIRNRYGATARIVFEEPQVNAPVEEQDLVPDLAGMSVLPLADFRFM